MVWGMKWGEDKTFKFVAEYVKHPCLVRTKHGAHLSRYNFKQARQAAIQKLVQVMNIPGFGYADAVIKIKNVRSTYSQELKKIRECPEYIPTLKWFKMFHEATKDTDEDDAVVIANAEADDDDSVQYEETREPSPEPECEYEETVRKPIKRKIRPSDSFSNIEETPNKIKIFEENVISQPNANYETEFDVFSRSVAAQLNAMPPVLAIKAQGYIQNYLTTIRVEHLNNSNLATHRMDPLHQ